MLVDVFWEDVGVEEEYVGDGIECCIVLVGVVDGDVDVVVVLCWDDFVDC